MWRYIYKGDDEVFLDLEAKKLILSMLSEIGEVAFESRREEMIPSVPEIESLESKLRYLLLWSMINQRTEAKIAGETTYRLYKKFGEKLFYNPINVIENFYGVTKTFQETRYPVRFAYLARDAIATLLVGSFLCFMIKLSKKQDGLKNKAKEGPRALANFLRKETLLSPMGEKATRMYVSFIGHPKINLTSIRYDKKELFVFVDGTVGKVFARTGLIEKVKRYRGNQVYAIKMRPDIDKLIQILKVDDPMMVDGGAYALGQFCCTDTNPSCESCQSKQKCIVQRVCLGKCPMSDLGCQKQVKWMAYKI